jgi:hypothetical protein
MRSQLLNAAVAGFVAGALSSRAQGEENIGKASEKPSTEKATIRCFGINSCKGFEKGHASCSVSPEDIAAAKETFGKKYEKSAPRDCAGMGSCKAKSGNLGWIAKQSPEECLKSKGFLIEKEGNKMVVKRK